MNNIVLNSQTAIAFCRLLATFLFGAAAIFGWSLDQDFLYNILVTIAAAVMFVVSWWKNNNVTQAAQDCQAVLDGRKCAEKEIEDIEKSDEI